ncbi:type III restriction enzyme, partial [Salipiger thiooxidans]
WEKGNLGVQPICATEPPETARLLQHWRHYQFEGIRPFFCQIEAVETAIWLTEVAPKMGPRVAKFWAHIKGANEQANPEL